MATGFGTPTNSPATRRQSSSLLPATDCQRVHQQLSHCFEDLADPRGNQGVLHPFARIVMIALLATIGGALGWEDIETYGVAISVGCPAFWPCCSGFPRLIHIGEYLSEYRPLPLSAAPITG